jgi:GH18 family chitinase
MRYETPATNSTKSTKFISGYWENWMPAINPGDGSADDKTYYVNDFAPLTHIFYSFLTLSKNPSGAKPPPAFWNGTSLYESVSKKDIITLLSGPDEG